MATSHKTKAKESAAQDWILEFIQMPRWFKRLVILTTDFLLLSLTLWVTISLRYGEPFVPPTLAFTLLLLSAPLITIAVFVQSGLYRLVTRYISNEGTLRIFAAVAVSVLIWALVILFSEIKGIPRSVIVVYGLLAAILVSTSRQGAGWLLRGVPNLSLARFNHDPTRVVIYGAGATGVQLFRELRQGGQHQIVGFVDESKNLWGQNVDGVKVYRPHKIPRLIERNNVEEIILALPEAPRSKKKAIIQSLESAPVVVKTLPRLKDIVTGTVQVSDLRPIDVDDLLGRDPVPPLHDLLKSNVYGKAVLVTGGGGSIGSELSRQVLKLQPRLLVIFEVSEPALYQIEMELTETLQKEWSELGERDGTLGFPTPTRIVPVLGSVLDQNLIERVLKEHKIDTIYHAAAYKHVPIVEQNPLIGIKNNTIGTQTLAAAALNANVERFVLISTDKAVRPSNVMGASKRLAELILQAYAAQQSGATVFTMVRFGNVLDSSGSVVRRFREQISNGGPVTVTHPEVIRYFMSIPEAAELVIQAGALATGGEVFVLDMGKPVRIDDLARLMIHLTGLEVQDDDNPAGDIPIEYVGLRPGEKLYEELLIGEDTVGTAHPRIMRCNEPHIPQDRLQKEMSDLSKAIKDADNATVLAILHRTVEEFSPERDELEKSFDETLESPPPPVTLH